MPTCEKCKKKFANKVKINGKIRNLQSRKYCLSCSPFGRHNTKVLIESKKKHKKCICQRCNKKYTYQRRRGDTKSYCAACHVTIKRLKVKEKAVKYKGGECQECGYRRCNRSLDFHHINSKEKEFAISNLYFRSWEKVKSELDKCILVCSNCHGEIHEGILVVQFSQP